MQRRYGLFLAAALLAWSLGLSRPLVAAVPTAAMFKGQVTVVDTEGLSIKARTAEIFRRCAGEKEGTVFFTAWAFPAFEQINSCQRHHGDSGNGPIVIKSRNGRILVDSERDHGFNLSSRSGTNRAEDFWGVLLFLNQVQRGRCRVSDVQLLVPDRECDLGGERLAWLGEADEKQGLEFIRGLLAQDSSRDLRKDLVFALYLFRGQAVVPDLVGLARRDPDMDIRKDAIFWLGQRASAAAVKALGDMIASPEVLEIKKHAVFALSQLDGDKGTPLLLEIARNNPHPRLRKEAIFWLGESGDPRALDFFEEILLK
jgi:hypothetical protein